MSTRTLILASPDRASPLLEELRVVFPAAQLQCIEGDWVKCGHSSNSELNLPALGFVQQCLPDTEDIAASSISAWSHEIVARILSGLREHAGKWRLHLIRSGETVGPRRLSLIEAAVDTELKDRRRKLWRNLVPNSAERWTDDEALVQVVLRNAEAGWFSLFPPGEWQPLRRCLSRYPAGRVETPHDPSAPSGAHAKLREVLTRWGRRFLPGETVVDLGASPGGWTHVAVEQGARVTAVDRSALTAELMRNPAVTFVKGDAFEFHPESPVDWLLSDVVAFPRDVVGLLERWLSAKWCHSFCVTIKFKGADDYPILREFAAMLDRAGADFCLRRLDANRNEVTVYGALNGDDERLLVQC